MLNDAGDKFLLGTLVFCFLILSIVYFFFGDSVKTAMKFLVTHALSPMLSAGEATVTSTTIYQGTFRNKSGQRSTVEVPTYQTVVSYAFEASGIQINTYDADYLYDEYAPHAMIKRIKSRLGAGSVSIHITDTALDGKWIPWFMRGKDFNGKSIADTEFLELIKSGSFSNRENKIVPIHFLSFAAHYNDLESYRPGLRLFLGQLERFGAVLMCVALLARLWYWAYKELFHSSGLTASITWLLAVFFIFIFLPARPLPTVLKNRKYASTFTIDEAALKRIPLPPQ